MKERISRLLGSALYSERLNDVLYLEFSVHETRGRQQIEVRLDRRIRYSSVRVALPMH